MILAGLGAGNLVLLALAGILLDLAVQSHHIFGQREIYGLRTDARARINTVYMTAVFLGGAVATAISGTLYGTDGWTGVTLLGAGLAFVALGVWAVAALRRPRTAAASAGHLPAELPSAWAGETGPSSGRGRVRSPSSTCLTRVAASASCSGS
jgi:MFS family permease